MSLGSLIGAVAGGVIGYVIGGPYGAFYGLYLGFTLGMIVDPMSPDMPSSGAPDQGDLVMSSKVGILIPDLAGTAKVVGHLLSYGGESAVAQYTESGGKGGSPDPVVTGYKYYMSWVLGIVVGEVDTLYAVYKNEDVVWEGELDCPASGGQETITLDGMGSATFYFGTDDHVANSKVGALLDDDTLNTPYRNLCWCFFDNCYIGEYNRTPTMKFILKKIPEYAFSTKHEIQTYDCNPAHVMWFILHNLTGLPESWLHSTDFATIATTLWGESRGLSVLFQSQQSALSYLESVNAHIDNILRYGIDGKFHPKLIRDDYTVGDLQLIDEDVMLEEPTFNRKSWIDTINEMKVQYSELFLLGESSVCFCVDEDAIEADPVKGLYNQGETVVLALEPYIEGCVYTWELISGAGILENEETKETVSEIGNRLEAGHQIKCYPAVVEDLMECVGTTVVGVKIVNRFEPDEFCDTIDLSVDNAFSFFWAEENPELVAQSANVAISVSEGLGPFLWSVAGAGFTLAEEMTAGRTNTLCADDTACGTATITVVDVCETSVEGYVRCIEGRWTQISTNCVLSGIGSVVDPCGAPIVTLIAGKFKQVDSYGFRIKQCHWTYIPGCDGFPRCTDTLLCLGWEKPCPDCWPGEYPYDCGEIGCRGECDVVWNYYCYVQYRGGGTNYYEWEC